MAGDEPLKGSGKVVPRLIRDLLDYDPLRVRKNGKNLLADPASRWTPDTRWMRRLDRDCQHNLYRKEEQTAVPKGDAKPVFGEFYKSASYCAKCLCHFDVTIDLSSTESILSEVCELDTKYPLHHLVPITREMRTQDQARTNDRYDTWIEKHSWHCSAPNCPAHVEVAITPPRLDKKKLELLSNRDVLRERGESVIAQDPDRYSDPPAVPVTPAEALNILRQYLNDSIGGSDRRVAARNKKFLLAFAGDCDEIFEWLGFTRIIETRNDEVPVQDKFWQLPSLGHPDLTAYPKTKKHLVQDVILELCQILSGIQDKAIKPFVYHPLSAMRDFNSMFGMTAYTTKQRVINLESIEHPYYASLGATDDFTDELVLFAYQRQISCDARNKAYYFECLKDIAEGRAKDGGGEALQLEVVTEASLGQETQTAIDSAYQYFNLTPANTDDHIVGVYHSRIEAAPRQADEAKSCLLIIGTARNSERILDIAKSQKMDPGEAKIFLGVQDNPNLDVDDIRAACTVALFDNDKEKVLRAVKAIQEEKNDFAIGLYVQELETGSKPELSLKDAYNRLQIVDPNMPDDTVMTYFTQLSKDAPMGSKQSYLEALNAIAVHRQSFLLMEKVKNPDGEVEAPKGQPDQPVGLANIGNTCYLNSLLQYYYTVKAVREVVMNFDHYKMPITEEALAKKRVGGRAVKENEIIRAQEFVPLLASLYKQLKIAPTRSVRPTQELAEMTLYSAEAEEQFRRASMSGIEPKTMSIAAVMNNTGEPFIGPQLPPPPPPDRPAPLPYQDATSGDVEMSDMSALPSIDEDTVSESTLVDQENPPGISDVEMNDAVVTEEPAHLKLVNGTDKEPVISVAELSPEDAIEIDPDETTPPPDYAPVREISPDRPPVPPRNKPAPIDTSGRTSKKRKLEFGAQQDVTEVIGNLMFNLQCAIKPTGHDPVFGEQIDIIRETFFGSNAVYLKKGDSYDKKVEPWANLIVFPDTQGSRTIYEALDVVFDEQVVEIDNANTTQYASINQLPPVLQIQIQRTQYDSVNHQASKNQNKIEFEETIYLDRYMDTEKVLQRRKESGKRKAQLQDLTERQKFIEEKQDNLSKLDIYDATKNLLMSLQEDDIQLYEGDLPGTLQEESEKLSTQLKDIESQRLALKSQIKEDFTDMREHRYTLQAVFIHKGGSGSGHHWVYIYDFKSDVWREYNDERVEIVKDRRKVFENEGWSASDTRPATAHYLVYVRDDHKEDLVDAVCRDMDTEVAVNAGSTTEHVEEWNPQYQNVDADQQLMGTGAWQHESENIQWPHHTGHAPETEHSDWSKPI